MPGKPDKHNTRSAGNAREFDTSKPPEGVAPALWEAIISIKHDLKLTLDNLIERTNRLELRTSVLESQGEDISNSVTQLVDDVTEIKRSINTLFGRTIRAEASNRRMYDELTDLKSYTTKYNIIINFDRAAPAYKENPRENSIAIARKFFRDQLAIGNAEKLYIPVAHRLGPQNGGFRAMLVKLPIATELSLAMSNLRKLAATNHFVTKQLPPAKRERKQFVLPTFKDARKDTSLKVTLKDDLLYINNTLQRKFQAPRLPEKSTFVSDPMTISTSKTVEEGGSAFTGFSTTVKFLDEVRASLDALVQLPGVAASTHLMYAYRIECPGGLLENFDSDMDFGVGLELLKHLQKREIKNTLFVATRTCAPDYSHIGNRRFDNCIQLCWEAHSSG